MGDAQLSAVDRPWVKIIPPMGLSSLKQSRETSIFDFQLPTEPLAGRRRHNDY